jgi:glycosyltransferase involved in cell wall biosynthesis
MPYSSSTGSSGVAHQAAEYGVPIVCADIPDFREMAEHERLAIDFYEVENTDSFVKRVVETLNSPARLAEMSWKNYQAAQSMTLPQIVNNYLQLFRGLSKKSVTSETVEAAPATYRSDTELAPGKVA